MSDYSYYVRLAAEGPSAVVQLDKATGKAAIFNHDYPNFVEIAKAVDLRQDTAYITDLILNGATQADPIDWFNQTYLAPHGVMDDSDDCGLCDLPLDECECDGDCPECDSYICICDDFDEEDEEDDDDDDEAPQNCVVRPPAVDVPVEKLADTIARYQSAGMDASNLIRFAQRLAQNPSYRSVQQLWSWCVAKDLTIDPDGYIVAYKGVTDDMLSLHAGAAFVDGKLVEGQIPNLVGTRVTMPRGEVNDDPSVGCHKGLHVGNYSYANGFGRVLLEVKVDPADVVSVPSDCEHQKMRTCGYWITAIHDSTLGDDLTHHEPEADFGVDGFSEAVNPGILAGLRKFLNRKRAK
jgi:hypothetical protein